MIVTMRDPNLKIGFIDRFLIMTEPYSIPAIIVFNKSDIYTAEDIEYCHILNDIYTKIGYRVLTASSLSGDGISELKKYCRIKPPLSQDNPV